MIFALDLGQAHKKQSKLPKTLDDFKHKICESLGVECDDQRVEAIFAGYDGADDGGVRQPIDTDEQFRTFMNTVESEPEAVANDNEEESELVRSLRAEIASLTRENARAAKTYEAQIKSLKDEVTEYKKRLVAMKQEIEDLRTTFQRKLLKEQGLRQQVEQQLEKQKAETQKVKEQLEKVSAVYEEKMRVQKEKFDEEKKRLMTVVSKQKEEIERKAEQIAQLEEEVESLKARVAELEDTVQQLEAKNQKLEKEVERLTLLTKQQRRINDELKQKYEDVRAKLAKSEQTAELIVQEPHPFKFEWTIPGIRQKLEKWERGRSCHSPQFSLEGVNDMMIEFFPRGDLNSYEGFTAVKVRVPDGTRVRWSFAVGEIWSGPRCDLYERHLWWCRSGVVWNNFCTVYDLERQIDETDTVTAVFELHPIVDDVVFQDPVDLGDPFVHHLMQEVRQERPEKPPSTGELLLNPMKHTGKPSRAASATKGGKRDPYSIGVLASNDAPTRRGYGKLAVGQSAPQLQTWSGGNPWVAKDKTQLPPLRPATRAGVNW